MTGKRNQVMPSTTTIICYKIVVAFCDALTVTLTVTNNESKSFHYSKLKTPSWWNNFWGCYYRKAFLGALYWEI